MTVSSERKELWRELDKGFHRLKELTLDLSVAGVMLTGYHLSTALIARVVARVETLHVRGVARLPEEILLAGLQGGRLHSLTLTRAPHHLLTAVRDSASLSFLQLEGSNYSNNDELLAEAVAMVEVVRLRCDQELEHGDFCLLTIILQQACREGGRLRELRLALGGSREKAQRFLEKTEKDLLGEVQGKVDVVWE